MKETIEDCNGINHSYLIRIWPDYRFELYGCWDQNYDYVDDNRKLVFCPWCGTKLEGRGLSAH